MSQGIEDFVHNVVEVGLLDGKVEPADPGEFQQGVQQRVHALGEALEGFELGDALFVQFGMVVLQQEGRVVVDAAQRLFQIVRGDVRELVQFLVAAEQLGVAVLEFPGIEAELLLGLFAIGDVADDPREQPSKAELHFADGQVHGERAAVLAQADDLAADADDLLLAGGQVVQRDSHRARGGRVRA